MERREGKGTPRTIIIEQIAIVDAINFIIDNSMKAYKDKYGNLEDAIINIQIKNDEIWIEDNAGGIRGEEEADKFISLERGLGLKKACYKLAETAKFISNSKDYSVQIELEKDYLDLKTMEYKYELLNYDETKSEGLSITIISNNSIKRTIKKQKFIEKLKLEVASTYRVFMREGAKININNQQIEEVSLGLLEEEIQIENGYIRIYKTFEGEEGKENGVDLFIDNWQVLNKSKDKESKWKSLQETGYTFKNVRIEVIYNLASDETKELIIENINELFWEKVRMVKHLFAKKTVGVSFDLDKEIAEYLMKKFNAGSNKEIGEEAIKRVYNILKDDDKEVKINNNTLNYLRGILQINSNNELRDIAYQVLDQLVTRSLSYNKLKEFLNEEQILMLVSFLFDTFEKEKISFN